MKILLIAPNYPPINKVSSYRPYFFAKTLFERGHQVTVITNFCNSKGDGCCLLYDRNVSRKIRISNSKSLLNSILKFAFKVLQLRLRGEEFDVIISTYGPTTSHAVGFFSKILYRNSFWIADYRDLWTNNNYYGEAKTGFVVKAKMILETILILPAKQLITVSCGLRSSLELLHNKKCSIIYNGFDRDELTLCGRVNACARVINICHTGTLYPGRIPDDFENMLYTMQNWNQNSDIKIKLWFCGHLHPEVDMLFKKYYISGLVEFLGFLSREESKKVQYSSDICLVLENRDASKKGVLTGKVFEYIASVKPIIAFGVDKNSEMSTIIRDVGLDLYVGDQMYELVSRLKNYSEGKYQISPNYSSILKYTRQKQSDYLVKLIRELFHG